MPRDRSLLRNRKPVQKTETEAMFISFIALETLYREYDNARAELEASVGKPICIDACGKCCENMTPVSSRLEAIYMLASASALPNYLDIKGKAEQWLTDQQIEFHDDPEALLSDFEALRHVGCPFLDADKTCMIYEYRPLACRSYGVIRSADIWCPRPLHYTEADNTRMIIGKDTQLGRKIIRGIQAVIGNVMSWKREYAHVGLLPSFIAKELVPQDKLNALPIAAAKRLRRESTIAPAFVEEFKKEILVKMEEKDTE